MTMKRSEVYVLSMKRKEADSNNYYDEYVDGDNPQLEIMEEDVDNPFIGMNKEELLKYSTQPCWRRLRSACVGLVLLGWLALLVTLVVIVMLYPKCTAAGTRSWWQKDAMYRVYVRSFKDSGSDGIGDIKGLTSKLDYIKDLGVGSVSLSPVYKRDHAAESDFAIIDHMDLDTDYGTMADMENLISEAHTKGLRIILDFVPNHTGKNHPWFTASSSSSASNDTYRNFYVWSDNLSNWRSYYGGVAWTKFGTRNQYYLHQFGNDLPDLNLRSSQVQEKLAEVLKFWSSKGIDGFFVRHSAYLFEDYDMRDEMKLSTAGPADNAYSDYDHAYTFNLPEVHDMISRWRSAIKNDTSEKIVLADIPSNNVDVVMPYYGEFQRDGAHLALNQQFYSNRLKCSGTCMTSYVHNWMSKLPSGRWANWVAGDENTDRLASRFDENFIRAYYLVTMLLPGTPILYYGDEILLKNVESSLTTAPGKMKQTMRTIMQWTDTPTAGFSTTDGIWLPLNSNTTNVKMQTANLDSMLHFIRNMTDFRKKTTFTAGNYHQAFTDASVFSFVREFNGDKGYLVAVNFGEAEVERNFAGSYSGIEASATVDMVVGSSTTNSVEDDIDTRAVKLKPLEGIVASWDYVASEEF